MSAALTVFTGRTSDHNDLAMRAAPLLGAALADRFGVPATVLGTPEPVTDQDWRSELAAARPGLALLAQAYQQALRTGRTPVGVLPRCLAALATLPVLAQHRPDAAVLWFDAHADLNTPDTSPSGFLNGMPISGAAALWSPGVDTGSSARLDLGNLVLAGTRDIDPSERAVIDRHAIPVVTPGPGFTERLLNAVHGRPVFLHLDCDVLEPGIVPTDFAVPDGLSLEQLHDACSTLAGGEIVGLEVAEYQGWWPGHPEPESPGPLAEALSPLVSGADAGAR